MARGSLALAIAVSAVVGRAVAAEARAEGDGADRFAFAVIGTATGDDDRATPLLLRAIGNGPARFVVHFDLARPSRASCADATSERRRRLLDASTKPVVPVAGAAQWADCGDDRSDPQERLERLGDALFAGEESLGQSPLAWTRQSTTARFHRYRENLRWQAGRVLFVTINLPDNNNNFRVAAGRNGEFEERLAANRAWTERAFRIATERRLAGLVIFVDAVPRFGKPMRAPDLRSPERDGYYEWKLVLRSFVPSFKGTVLLVQSRPAPDATTSVPVDRPLLDSNGKPVANLWRTSAPAGEAGRRWLRVEVDARAPALFNVSTETLFDDPSGELYGKPLDE